jgi:hypothetical protein
MLDAMGGRHEEHLDPALEGFLDAVRTVGSRSA